MTLMAKAEYADRRGWSRAYVSKLVKQGRLVLTPEGKAVSYTHLTLPTSDQE